MNVSLTSAMVDARRLHNIAYIPNLVVLTFIGAVLACIFWGGPLWWFAAVAVGCLILGRMVQHRSAVGALVLALAVTAFATMALADVVKEGEKELGTLLLGLILVGVVPAIFCWRAVAGAFRLRARFPHSPLAAGHRKLRIPWDRGMRQVVVPAAACTIYFGLGTIAMFFGFLLGHGIGAGVALRPFSRRANRQYRKILQALSYRAQEVRAQDMRPPVLFLRSFIDEDLALKRRSGFFIDVLNISRTLEEVVVDRMWSVGPVVAIGRPVAELSPLGAAREYIDGPDWQSRVATLVSECSLVVSVLGETEGLLWEYRRLAAGQTPLLLVVPHGNEPVLLHRWRLFCDSYPAAASISVPEGKGSDFPLVVWFQPRHEPLVLTCKQQNEVSYELAFDELLFCRGLSNLSGQQPS
jgi:hypothetical protein